jgi:hypothetical protein
MIVTASFAIQPGRSGASVLAITGELDMGNAG